MQIIRKFRFILLCLGIFALLVLFAPAQTTIAQGPNILGNPGFEGGYYNHDGIPELAVPNGWRMWWLDNQAFPGSNGNALRPETVVWFRGDAPVWEQDLLFRDGSYSLKIFKGGAPVYAGMSQDLNLQKGARYRFVVPIFADLVWAYNDDGTKTPNPNPAGGGIRLGASQQGATWRDAGTINYSGWWTPANTPNFHQNMLNYIFDFTATANQMTVWLEMYGADPMPNNGFFVDGLSLVKIADPPTSTPRPTNTPLPTNTPIPTSANTATPTLTPTNTPTPLPTGKWYTDTPTPIPPTETPAPIVGNGEGGAVQQVAAISGQATPDADGNIYAMVGPGDSVWSVAAKNGLTLDQILEYNNFPSDQAIFVAEGDLLIVGFAEPAPVEEEVVAETAADTASETSTDTTAAEGSTEEVAEAAPVVQPTDAPTEAPVGAEICLKAFEDSNQNALHDGDEPMREGVAFTILAGERVITNWLSDGQQTFCVPNLTAGAYRVTRSKLANEQLTTGGEMAIALTDGASAEIAFGSYTMSAEEMEAASEQPAVQLANAVDVQPVEAPASAPANDENPANIVLLAVVAAAVLLLVAILVILLSRRSA